jgi:hypothetical protein
MTSTSIPASAASASDDFVIKLRGRRDSFVTLSPVASRPWLRGRKHRGAQRRSSKSCFGGQPAPPPRYVSLSPGQLDGKEDGLDAPSACPAQFPRSGLTLLWSQGESLPTRRLSLRRMPLSTLGGRRSMNPVMPLREASGGARSCAPRLSAYVVVAGLLALLTVPSLAAADPTPQYFSVCGEAGHCKRIQRKSDVQFLSALLAGRVGARHSAPSQIAKYFVIHTPASGGSSFRLGYFVPETSKLAIDGGAWVKVSPADTKRLIVVLSDLRLRPALPPSFAVDQTAYTVPMSASGTATVPRPVERAYVEALSRWVQRMNSVVSEIKPTSLVPTGRRVELPVHSAVLDPWFQPSLKLVSQNVPFRYFPDAGVFQVAGKSYMLPGEVRKLAIPSAPTGVTAAAKKASRASAPTSGRAISTTRVVLLVFGVLLAIGTVVLFSVGATQVYELISNRQQYVEELDGKRR